MKQFSKQQEIDLCEKYKNNYTINNLCEDYNCDASVIYRILNKNSIKRKKSALNEKAEEITSLYEQGMRCVKISRELNLSRSFVAKYLKNKYKNVIHNRQKKYTINDNFFENIDTPEKAQILGLWFADGCILQNFNRSSLSLKEDDLDYLENINSYMNHSRPVIIHKKESIRYFKSDDKSYKTKNAYGIIINSEKIKNDLMMQGIVYNKSDYDFGFPKIPKNLFNSFILGYFEGDGCITTSPIKNRKCISKSFSILCQPLFANNLKDIFNSELDIDCKIYTRSAKPTLRTVSITKNNDIIKLYHWLYKDVSFCMKRKHDTFCYILNNLSTYGYDIGKTYDFD
jgi:hypothetical protein